MAPTPIEIILDDYWTTLLLGAVLPAVVALVTKQLASGSVKALTLLALSIIAGALTQVQQNGGHFELWATVGNILLTFTTGVIAHFGLLEPTRITGKQGVIQQSIPGGIGTEVAQAA